MPGCADAAANSARDQRRAALERLATRSSTCVVIGGGVDRRGLRARRGHARAERSRWSRRATSRPGPPRRSSKLVHGGLRYLEQLELRRSCARRCASAGCCSTCSRRTSSRPVPFLLPLTEHWQRAYIGAGLALYDSLGGHEGLPRHRHLTRRGALRIAPALQRGRARRRDPVLRRQGRRRPPHADRRPHGRVATARRCVSNARVVGFLREGERVTGVRVRDAQAGERDRRARPRGRQRHRRVDRRRPGPGRRAREVPGARVQGHAPRRPARPHAARHRADPAHRDVACCSSSRGAGTGSSARPTPTGSSTRRTRRRPRRDIDYVLEQRQRGAHPAADARGRRGRLRRAAAAADRRVEGTSRALARAHRRRAGAGAGGGRGRQVHDLPRDGPRRDRRRRARAGPLRAAVGHRRHPAARRRRLPGAVEPARAAGARLRSARRAHRAPAAPLRVADRRPAALSPSGPTLAEPLPGADDYLAVEVRYA